MIYYYTEELPFRKNLRKEAPGVADVKEKNNEDITVDTAGKTSVPWLILNTAGFLAGVLSCCSFGHEVAAGVFMMGAAIFIGFFARERATVAGIIIPAYLFVLFTGRFAVSAFYLGICAAIGAGAFLLRVSRLAFGIASVLAVVCGAVMQGAAGAFLGAAVIPAVLVLGAIYPRSTVGVAVGCTALAAVLSAVVFGGLFLAFSPEFGIPEGVSDVSGLVAALRGEFIRRVTAVYAASGIEAGMGAVTQYVDTVICMLPGILAAAAEVTAFFAMSVCGALFRGFELEPPEFTNAEARYIISPVGGLVYVAAVLTYIAASGGDVSVDTGSISAAAAENIMLAMSLPLAVFAISWARGMARRAGLAGLGTAMIVAAALSVIFAGWQGISVFSAFGTVLCFVLPIYRSVRNRAG